MNVCDKCKQKVEFIEEDYGSVILSFCPVCYAYIRTDCKHYKTSLVKYSNNGGWAIRRMCSLCYKMIGDFIAQEDCEDIDKLHVIIKEKHDRFHSDNWEKLAKRLEWLTRLHEEYHKSNWFSEHNDYLKSETWQEKREEVLRRDKYLCQACLKRKATEIHHLSYDHWKNEPLYELISVCHECHQAITEIDRKNQKIA